MKVKEIVEKLNEKQKRTVRKCIENCGLPEMEAEVEAEVPTDVIEFLKVIANPLRFKILKMTRDHWLCVCLLAQVLEADQTLISHHLRTLKRLNLVEERREGRMHFYRARKDVIEEYLQKVGVELLGD